MTSQIIALPFALLNLESVGKEGKKNREIWISRERKELFRWNKKTFFIVFEGLSFSEKIKNKK